MIVAFAKVPLTVRSVDFNNVGPCAVDISRELADVSLGLDREGYVDRVTCIVGNVNRITVVLCITFGVLEAVAALVSVTDDLLYRRIPRAARELLILVIFDKRSSPVLIFPSGSQ